MADEAIQVTLRVPKELMNRVDDVADWSYRRPEMMIARKSRTSLLSYLLIRGVLAVEKDQATGTDDADWEP